jgi:hypothetical protein
MFSSTADTQVSTVKPRDRDTTFSPSSCKGGVGGGGVRAQGGAVGAGADGCGRGRGPARCRRVRRPHLFD